MTVTFEEPAAATESAWRAEFGALLLEIDRQAVALDVQRWLQPVPGGTLSVIEHLQQLQRRWRAVLAAAPEVFLPEPAPGAVRSDRAGRAVRPAVVLHAWRREGRAFPGRLTASYDDAAGTDGDRPQRQYLAELTALRRCLGALRAATAVGRSGSER